MKMKTKIDSNTENNARAIRLSNDTGLSTELSAELLDVLNRVNTYLITNKTGLVVGMKWVQAKF